MKPIIHVITNYVSAPDIANMLTGLGAFPIMADSYQDLVYSYFDARVLMINIGTPNPDKEKGILFAYERAFTEGVPIVLDIVGYGTTQFRTDLVNKLLSIGKPCIIKGNYSEMYSLYSGEINVYGVGSDISEETDYIANMYRVNLKNEDKNPAEIAKRISKKYKTLAVITGEKDYISAEYKIGLNAIINGGNPMLSKISGMGCMLGAYFAYKLSLKWCNCALQSSDLGLAFDSICAASKQFRNASLVECAGPNDLKIKFLDNLCNEKANKK